MPIIFYSTQDAAGSNIAKALVENHGFEERELEMGFFVWDAKGIKLVQVEDKTVDSGNLSHFFSSDLFVFASRHSSESGKPCLTVHAPENWNANAEVGGNPKELALTSAKAIKCAFVFLSENRLEGFDPFLECSHHGPTALKHPCIFIEVGSTEKEWNNEAAVELVSEAVLHVCRNYEREAGKVSLGFGGGHYCPCFGKLEGEYAFSHVAPKYVLDGIEKELVAQAVEKTVEDVELAVIDGKGTTKEQRNKLVQVFEELGLKWEKR